MCVENTDRARHFDQKAVRYGLLHRQSHANERKGDRKTPVATLDASDYR
jgi:hypothetical protein